jgi:hypothetical protein
MDYPNERIPVITIIVHGIFGAMNNGLQAVDVLLQGQVMKGNSRFKVWAKKVQIPFRDAFCHSGFRWTRSLWVQPQNGPGLIFRPAMSNAIRETLVSECNRELLVVSLQ